MSNFQMFIDWFFSLLTSCFNFITNHWLLGLFLMIWLLSLIVELFQVIRGSR